MRIEAIGFVLSYVLVYTIGYVWSLSPHEDEPKWWYFVHWFILAAIIVCITVVIADLGRPGI